MHEFDDIRPYRDDEVRAVVDTLVQDQDFIGAMAKFKKPTLYRFFPGLLRRLTQNILEKQLKNVNTIDDVQLIIEEYLDVIIETTTDGLTQSGLEQLDPKTPYLFISNHRDITMDPALVNYMLHHHGFETVDIAIGDNLLKKPFLSDLMRLNKCFIVKRSLQGREMLKASKQLSAYIKDCIRNGRNVWIAQREGRAKDGIDRTEPAVLKMLHLHGRSASPKQELHESINTLNIIPVSISYEYDPCDRFKSEELLAIDTTGKFEKDEDTDAQSILNGMVGNKGTVNVAFGTPLKIETVVTTEGVAALLDEQIIANYKLHAVNYLAMEKVQADFMDFSKLPELCGLSEKQINKKRRVFEQRLAGFSAELQHYVLNMYANPVVRKFEQEK